MPQTSTPTGNAQRTKHEVPGTERAVGEMKPIDDLVEYLRAYAGERPEVAAMWCFGIGFVVGWKLKPW